MLAGIIPPYLPHHSQLFNNKFQLINPFHITSLFLSFLMFSGVQKETSGMKWAMTNIPNSVKPFKSFTWQKSTNWFLYDEAIDFKQVIDNVMVSLWLTLNIFPTIL